MRPDAARPDEDETRFLVSHRLQHLPHGGTRAVIDIRIEGRDAEALGPRVTADAVQVLAALQALARG